MKNPIATKIFGLVNLFLCFCFFFPLMNANAANRQAGKRKVTRIVKDTTKPVINVPVTEQETSENLILLEKDNKSLLRNPCMGWGLYDDAADEVQDAGKYWKCQSDAATRYASFFYVRWRWADMEPEEGKYAWIYDNNYKQLIKGALDRGLKLAFRIYYDSRDNYSQATPDYVRQAGAEGFYKDGKWSPYPDNPVFQQKLNVFLKAFAAEYDNPDIVDFIDGYNIGLWGEGHNLMLQGGTSSANKERTLNQITDLYATNFKRIHLVITFGSEVGYPAEKKYVLEPKGYGMRRDGLGSRWFNEEEKKIAQASYGKRLLVGESCYWYNGREDIAKHADFKPWQGDPVYNAGTTWRDVYELTCEEAIHNHFNTLDLREIGEAEGWLTEAPDLVQKFILRGGYRFFPSRIELPLKAKAGTTIKAIHHWTNDGTGYLPNNMVNWNYKYKPAFALINKNNEIVKIWIDEDAEPSTWLYGNNYTYEKTIRLTELEPGEYQWAIAIIDKTRNNKPGIKLAIKNEKRVKGWSILRHIAIE